MLLKGNCLELLAEMPDNSVDSIVTDPPYELGFMGKSWDNSGIAYNVELWSQALRVLKPGGHLLAFGGSRTYHRLASAVEDAGFEIRDQIMWLYGSGFPKSHNVGKAIDKAAGLRKAVGVGFVAAGDYNGRDLKSPNRDFIDPELVSPEAQQWQGWGTALKPAHEPIVVARKPLIGTIVANVLTYGTGGLNIDGSRVGYEKGEVNFDQIQRQQNSEGAIDGAFGASALIGKEIATYKQEGRWPANVIHDGSEEVLEGFPITTSGKIKPYINKSVPSETVASLSMGLHGKLRNYDSSANSGSAARFFYCAKASKSERNAGLENQNFHPTVKPIALMRYLVKLVTPPNGIVLDPFLGSGTTAVAAILEGFNWMGCEMTEDYWPIIEARVAWAELQPKTLL